MSMASTAPVASANMAPFGSPLGIMRLGEVLLAILLSGALEAFLSWVALRGMVPLAIALSIHGLVVAALAAWIVALRNRRAGLRMACLLLVSTAGLGPFGPAGTLLTVAIYAWFRRSATPFDEWYLSLFPQPKVSPALELYREITLGRDDTASEQSVASFTDILGYGSVAQKQALIGLLANHYRAAFAPALQAALSHEDPSIRVQAATAATMIENRYAAELEHLDAEVKARPHDPAARLALARFHDDYASSGLLDTVRQRESRAKALELYQECVQLGGDNTEILDAMGQLHVRLGDHESALEVMDRIGRSGPPTTFLWYLEALFHLERFGQLRGAVREKRDILLGGIGREPALAQVVELWAPSAVGRGDAGP
jgi:hypothetical protein